MLPGKRYSARDIGAILVRRRWLVLLPLAIGLALPAVTGTVAEPAAQDAVSVPVTPGERGQTEGERGQTEEGQDEEGSLGALGAGAAAGFALGLALVALIEYRHSGFTSDYDVLRVLTLPVLGTVPVMTSARERRFRRCTRVAVDLAGGLVVVSAVLFVTWRLRF